MKTKTLFVSVLLAALPLVAARAAPAPAVPQRVHVEFFEPKNFTDIGDTYMASEKSRNSDLDLIREYLVDTAARYVPQGEMLEITFEDIDLAGDFEPWRGPQLTDVRIVKEIYPPAMKFSFKLTDAEGNVLKQGKRELRDMNFMMKLTLASRNDPFRHEKSMLDDWLSSEFRVAKKT